MRRSMKRSFGFALSGLVHAFKRERNIRLFLYGYIVVIGVGAYLRLLTWEWLTIIIAGGLFLCTELLNTAIERFVDVVDHNRKMDGGTGYHANLKAAKDVAASASLVALSVNILVIVIVFWPYAAMQIAIWQQK
ncbi:MAG TPA: diacylglycerol kinase family protein [Candidatus Peribacteraceae bacterium]|nr:diacylglycerol kinase family protein [Candidatus Peribacteraceae bacterium]